MQPQLGEPGVCVAQFQAKLAALKAWETDMKDDVLDGKQDETRDATGHARPGPAARACVGSCGCVCGYDLFFRGCVLVSGGMHLEVCI